MDSSTKKTGISVYDNGKLTDYFLIECEEELMDDRFKHMGLNIWKSLSTLSPNMIYIEETVVNRNVQVQRFLTRLQGIVYAWTMNNDCDFNTIRPTEWRKLVKINSSKKKRDILKQEAINLVKQKYGIDVNDDVAEAILIGQAIINKYGEVSNAI